MIFFSLDNKNKSDFSFSQYSPQISILPHPTPSL